MSASGAYVLAGALAPLAIPSTLQDALMARLDRLAPVKEIAQIGAAIGREFSYRLLEAVSPITGAALQDALRQLMAAELIYGRGAPPEANYSFKHALVQDTAYASLLRSRRQRIHADIARALEERFADQIEAAPAILAHHYAEAGLAEPAARYWLKAAELALSRSAYAEANRYVEAGLALIPRLTDGPERQSLELTLQLARANALLTLKGYSAPETVAALTIAKQLLDARVLTKDRPENQGFLGEGVDIVVEVVVDPQRQIDHFHDLGDNFCAAAKPREEVTNVAVILLDRHG